MLTLGSRLSAALFSPALTTLAVLTAAIGVLGRHQQPDPARAALLFLLLAALTVGAATNVAFSAFASESTVDRAIAAAVISFAIVVACGLVFGALKVIGVGSYLAAAAALFAWSLRGLERRDDADSEWALLPAPIVGALGALVALAAAYAVAHAPLTLYDSLSYHLFFPARWLQERAVSIVPTPFSDPAQAYAPGNGELFLLWLMLPFHSDWLARIGQLPFALVTAVILYALARRLGASPAQAVYPPAFLLLSRPVLEEAIGANVDLMCAAMFSASIYLMLVAFERDRRRDWLLCGVSLGLYFGSKYLALIYAPAILVLALAGRPRLKMLWALPGLAAFALPWYARNWIVAGSPIYPASVTVAGAIIARGAFDRLSMLNTVFHTTDPRLFGIIAAHAFGPTLFVVWLPAAIVGGIALLRRGWWPRAVLALLPGVMALLFWFGLPVNIDSRFLMPAVPLALLPIAFTFGTGRTREIAVHAIYVAAAVWILVGAHAEIRPAAPWFMGGWLKLDGLLTRDAIGWWAVLAVLTTTVWWAGPRHTRWALPFAAALLAATTTAVALAGERWSIPPRGEYLSVTSPYLRANLIVGWRWMADHVHDATIAYTGINLPYPLAGDALTNRVIYVNIDGRPGWRFHDYDRAYRRGAFKPAPPLLATQSGELLPVSDRFGPALGAIRPRYERMQGIRDAWIDNLRRFHVDYLFVSSLSAYEIDNVWHDGRGFPIENEWAGGDAGLFHLAYENPQVRVFAINLNEDDQ